VHLFMLLIAAAMLLVIVRVFREAMSSLVPPPRIHLVPTRKTQRHARDVAARARELEACGFAAIGVYRAEPMRGVVLSAFVHSDRSVCAVVYDHPMGCFVDVIVKNEAGRGFTATTAPIGERLDQREGQEKVFDPGMAVPAMLEMVLQRRPSAPWQTWNEGNFVAKFEEAYARDMDWRAGRGGITSDEVRRFAEASGRRISDGDLQSVTHRLQRRFMESRRHVR
jgi:hypothetical protein